MSGPASCPCGRDDSTRQQSGGTVPIILNPSFTDWVQDVPRRGIFLNNSRRYRVPILPIFLFVH